MIQAPALLIDWLTLRIPLGPLLHQSVVARILECTNTVHCVNFDGEVLWRKRALDIDALRSDTVGLMWMVQSDGQGEYLSVGASPSSLEHGINVFGSLDIQHCAQVLISKASKAISAILPGFQHWQCCRVDITGNYVLPDAQSVKQALRQLALADGGRRKATNKLRGGDSVYWNPSSDLAKGKAYHKGPQMLMLRRQKKMFCSDELIDLANRILRLEHTRGARYFREQRKAGINWHEMTSEFLQKLYMDFFERIAGGVEVSDMARNTLVKRIRDANGITEGRAEAAFATYRNIRADGFEVVKGYVPKATWYRHLKYLRAAGICDADMQMSNIIPFQPVRIILAQPISSWEDIRRAA